MLKTQSPPPHLKQPYQLSFLPCSTTELKQGAQTSKSFGRKVSFTRNIFSFLNGRWPIQHRKILYDLGFTP